MNFLKLQISKVQLNHKICKERQIYKTDIQVTHVSLFFFPPPLIFASVDINFIIIIDRDLVAVKMRISIEKSEEKRNTYLSRICESGPRVTRRRVKQPGWGV